MDIISQHKEQKAPIVIFSMCKKHIIYIYQHNGRTKVVAGNGLKQVNFKQILTYIKKNPLRSDGKYITTIIPLPCPEPEYSSKIMI